MSLKAIVTEFHARDRLLLPMQFADFGRLCLRFFKRHIWGGMKFLLMVIFIYVPVTVISAMADKFIQDAVGKSWAKVLSLQTLAPYLPYSPLLLLFLIGQYWRKSETGYNISNKRLYSDLGDFFKELKLGRDRGAEARCVVWVAVGNKDGIPTHLKQLTPYYPDPIVVAGTGPKSYRESALPPRLFKVAKYDQGHIKPIGVLGRFVHECVTNSDDSGSVISVPLPTDCLTHCVNVFNFTPKQAERLTQDRRCFMFLPIMTDDKTQLLAVVLCDAKIPDYYDLTTVKKAQRLLPRLAKSLLR